MNQARLRTIALTIGVIATPACVSLFLLLGYLRVNLNDFVPHYRLEDDLFYWRQIYTFSAVGFNGGYYTMFELPAATAFTHYYGYGPWHPLMYGTLGRLLGWYHQSPPFINLLLMTTATAVLLLLAKPRARQLVFISALLATSWPLHLFIPSTLQESLHHAFAIVLAFVFYRIFRERSALPWKMRLLFTLLLFGMALTRMTWALLFLPMFLLMADKRWQRLLALALAGALILLILEIARAVNSPVFGTLLTALPAQFSQALTENGLLSAVGMAAEMVWINLTQNIAHFTQGEGLEVAMRMSLLIFAGSIIIAWARKTQHALLTAEAAFHLYNPGSIILAVYLLYINLRIADYRLLGGHMLLAGLLLILMERYRLATLLIGLNLLMLPLFLAHYVPYAQEHFTYDTDSIEKFSATIDGQIVYDAKTENAWCNTLLFDYWESYSPELLALPPGIGTSFFIYTLRLGLPPKSKYLLLTPLNYDKFATTTQLQQLAITPIGSIYRNLDADCP